jgi:predicted PP-loop superfamily ATPase
MNSALQSTARFSKTAGNACRGTLLSGVFDGIVRGERIFKKVRNKFDETRMIVAQAGGSDRSSSSEE